MNAFKEPYVVGADRLDGSVIITFADGRCGLYSSALLYTTLSQARELCDLGAEDPALHDASKA